MDFYRKVGTKLIKTYPIVDESGFVICSNRPEDFIAHGLYPKGRINPNENTQITDWELINNTYSPVYGGGGN